jgi:uncharacterized protein (TIGR03437 family)
MQKRLAPWPRPFKREPKDWDKMKLVNRIITAIAFSATATLAWSQSTIQPDASGNGRLNGNYFFRQLSVVNYDSSGNVTEMAVVYGKIVFDGKGGYVLSGQKVDNAVSGGQPQPLSVTASYSIGANALGSLDNPLDPTNSASWVYGGVGQGGIFTGSSTEGTFNDTFIAVPAAATTPTNATLSGTYSVGVLDFPGAKETSIKNALFKIAPDGKGGLGSLSLVGQIANQSPASITQTASGATYAVQTDGSFTLTVPTPSSVTANNSLFSGTKTLYVSSDGNFVVGGTTNGFDIFFGVKASATAFTDKNFSGLYFLGALEDAPAYNGVDSFYGSVNSNGAATQIMHWRFTAPYEPYAFDYGNDDDAGLNTDGTITDSFGYSYAFGGSGASFVAVGTAGLFSLVAGVQSPSFTGTGVFLNPAGVTNAASYSPVTASFAPGELLTLFGSGLAPATLTTQGGQVFPTTLGGVQVLMNGIPAPIYYVSPTQISVIVPYALDPTATPSVPLLQIQVVNGGTKSQPVTWWLNDNQPGLFTAGQNGTGIAAALRYDSSGTPSIISASNPTHRGETISLFLTGLGAVTPKISDGGLGPTSTLSQATAYVNNYMAVYFNDYTNNTTGAQATINYAGLAPGLAGLYQMNVVVPSTVGPGNVYIEIDTDAASIIQVYLPIQ